MSTVRTYLRAIAYADESLEGCVCSTGFAVVSPGYQLVPRFLFYWLRSDHIVDEICARSVGISYPAINPSDFPGLPVAVPEHREQQVIADFLDRRTAAIDALIEKKERLIGLLEEKRQALITQAVTKGLDPSVPMKDSGVEWLGEVPAHWEVRPVGYLTRSTGGCTPSKDNEEFWNGDIPWVSPKDMKVETLSDSEDHVSRKALVETGLSLVPPPVVLIVVRGMILARHFPVAVTQEPVTLNQDMKAMRPVRNLSARYLALSLRGLEPAALSLVEEAGHGTKRLRTDLWSRFPVPLPPLGEQLRIVEATMGVSSALTNAASRLADSVNLLREYRQALITAAVTGKIDVTKEAAS